VLADPPQVLSATPLCCQCHSDGRGPLRRLSIKVRRWLGKLHTKDCLDAGVHVEGFTSPAGSDGADVGMLEAVHRSHVINLCPLSLPPQRDVEMLRQVLITI
jgi:hypothetical protein